MKTRPLRVPGFRAAGVHCGIKDSGLDLALIASDVPAAAAGLFTRSSVVGAPVELCRAQLRSGRARGVVVNSGISNVAMGARGKRDAAEMVRCAARALGAAPEEMLVASTGVIGEALPMPRVRRGIRAAAAAMDEGGLARAAEAIMTTDTFPKTALATVRVAGRRVTVAGVAKGSGMIEPNLATMLAFLVSDAAIAPGFLRSVLRLVPGPWTAGQVENPEFEFDLIPEDLPLVLEDMNGLVIEWTGHEFAGRSTALLAEILANARKEVALLGRGKALWFVPFSEDERVGRFLRFNEHEGTTWLNQEALENLLDAMVVCGLTGRTTSGAATSRTFACEEDSFT